MRGPAGPIHRRRPKRPPCLLLPSKRYDACWIGACTDWGLFPRRASETEKLATSKRISLWRQRRDCQLRGQIAPGLALGHRGRNAEMRMDARAGKGGVLAAPSEWDGESIDPGPHEPKVAWVATSPPSGAPGYAFSAWIFVRNRLG